MSRGSLTGTMPHHWPQPQPKGVPQPIEQLSDCPLCPFPTRKLVLLGTMLVCGACQAAALAEVRRQAVGDEDAT